MWELHPWRRVRLYGNRWLGHGKAKRTVKRPSAVASLVAGKEAAPAGRRVWLVALVLLACAGPAWAQAGWWNYRWQYRRMVTVTDVPRTRCEGEEVGVVTMPTGGLMGRGGRDIRVVTATGLLVPHRVLMTGPGDVVRLAFALRPGHRRYFVYFGNPKSGKEPPALKIRRGVLLESWLYQRGPIATLRQVQHAFDTAGVLLGRDFRDKIFLGHNPFGPQGRVCNLFTAYVFCRTSGEYTFSTSSQDASFLLVDGKLVVSNGGRHRPQRRAYRRGRIDLNRGLHEIKVYHISTGWVPVIVVAWREPNAKRLWTIPPEAFTPVRRARPGMLERYGRAVQADFIPVHAGESFMANRYYQRYAFAAMTRGAVGRKVFQWDFGDGQKAAGERCEHVYLRDGPYKVTLTARLGTQTVKRVNEIYVTRPWDQVTINRLDPVADHARIVAGYDFSAADPRDIGEAIRLFKRAGMSKAILRAGDALVKRKTAPSHVLRDALGVYAEALVAAGEPARAVAALLKGAEMTRSPAVAAALSAHGGRVELKGGDPHKALQIFQHTIKSYSALTTHRAIREARIGIGDVWRKLGDYDKARAAYAAAGELRKSTFEKAAVRKGDLARHAEDYLRRRQFNDAEEYLDKLEYEFPAEKLEGFSTLLRARLELARRRYAEAAEQAEQLVRVNPRSNYAPELLMLAAEACRALGKADAARTALRRIVQNYPESPLAAKARKQLAGE